MCIWPILELLKSFDEDILESIIKCLKYNWFVIVFFSLSFSLSLLNKVLNVRVYVVTTAEEE